MSILKYKYKAHKFINYAFYLVVFIAGFLIGFGTKKLDFNKLISQFLMIDNVSAYNISNSYINIENAEEHVLNNIPTSWKSNFKFEEYPYVIIKTTKYTNYDCWVAIYFFKNLDTVSFGANVTYYSFQFSSNSDYYFYFLNQDGGSCNTGGKGGTGSGSIGTNTYSKQEYYTNFDITDVSSYSNTSSYTYEELNNRIHLLDFAGSNLKFNENLFKDNPDFKEVCVSNYDTFSITSNSVDGYDENEQPYYHSFDFMWFPNGMKGISTYRYDTEEENHVYIFEESETTFSGWWYWLNTKEEIDLYFGRDNPGLYLELRGYTDKYKYYNYTMYPFEMAFTPSYHYYPVFWFKDPYIEYLDGTKKDDSDKYCFYIKNEYDVNILNHDSMGDVYGDVTILGGTISSDSTSKNLKDMDNSTLVNTLYNLLNRLKNTINFINYHIESLFFSMPLLFQMFIVSVLLIFAIKLIINMIIK